MNPNAGQFAAGKANTIMGAPGRWIGEKCPQQTVRQGMPGPNAGVTAKDRTTGQRKIAQRIQHLVAHRFVGVAKTAR